MDVARRMTLEEYRLRFKGYMVRVVEQQRQAYTSAFARRAADAVTDDGKSYKYRSPSDVFDSRESLDNLFYGKRKTVNEDLLKIAMNLREYHKEGGGDGKL